MVFGVHSFLLCLSFKCGSQLTSWRYPKQLLLIPAHLWNFKSLRHMIGTSAFTGFFIAPARPGWQNVHSVLCKAWTRDGLVHQCPEYPQCNDPWMRSSSDRYVVLYLKFNSSYRNPKRKAVFQPSLFRGENVKFWGCCNVILTTENSHVDNQFNTHTHTNSKNPIYHDWFIIMLHSSSQNQKNI